MNSSQPADRFCLKRSIATLTSLSLVIALSSCATTRTGSYPTDSSTSGNPSGDTSSIPDSGTDVAAGNQGNAPADKGDYSATAIATYTWLVDYTSSSGGAADRPPRIEEFSAVSLENKDGQRPDEAVTGPDDQGLWWPALPPRPTLEEMESRQQRQETFSTPRLNKTIQYRLTFDKEGQTVTLPTNASVYRQVTKLYPNRPPIEVVMDPLEKRVTKINPSF